MNWIGEKKERLRGFSWHSNSSSNHICVSIWNDIFLHEIEETGKKIAIIVIDTENQIDHEAESPNNLKIFELSALLSSIHVLNFTGLIDEEIIQNFDFMKGISKFFSETKQKEVDRPFQNLMLLVRDWVSLNLYFN